MLSIVYLTYALFKSIIKLYFIICWRVIMPGQKFTTYIDSELLKKAKKQAIDEDTTVNKIIEKLLKEYLEKIEKLKS